MGVLILKLNEYRMCTSEENQPLRHVTVMEEAHNILKRSPTGGSEGSNVQAKSVEMISSAIAEMRTYGEGFIIVDQSPTAVDVSAVKNTNTKIIMRLPDYEDCKIAGLSMGLLVYDLGGGTFDITMINIKPGEIRVICTGGDHNLGGKDWDDRVLMYLAEQYQSETGTPDNILEDAETLQELSLAAERAKKLLSAKEKAPVAVNYMGERVRVELTREKFDELTEDLLTRTIDLTREMFKEAEKKGFTQNDVSEILLVGGSSKMPQVMSRVKSAFGIETKMFDPDESVAKGAAIYANKMSEFNIVLEEIAKQQGKSVEEVKEQVDKGQMNLQKEAKKANIQMRGGRLPGEDVKIINVSSRSFGTCAYQLLETIRRD